MSRRFLAAAVPVFVIAACYWPIVILSAPTMQAARSTLLGNIALSIYQPVFLPFIAGILFAGLAPKELIGNSD